MSSTIPLSALRTSSESWPRFGLDPDRVEEFAELYRTDGPDALPPIEVVRLADAFLVADGHYRSAAASAAGLDVLPAIERPTGGRDPHDLAFEAGVTSSSATSLPLSREEKREAIRRLIATGGSDREIGRLVGVAHTTVGRQRLAQQEEADPTTGPITIEQSADQLARRLVGGLGALWERRGLMDHVLGDRMGKRLAVALDHKFGDDALTWAHRLASWADDAVRRLEEADG
jgi:ParB-like chromosome segregation protein Spo0J